MNSTYFEALAFDKDLGATRGIDAALKQFELDALILPAPGFTTVPAAIAGYPIVTGMYQFTARSSIFEYVVQYHSVSTRRMSLSPWPDLRLSTRRQEYRLACHSWGRLSASFN